MSTIGNRVTDQRGWLVVNKPAFNNMAEICNIFRNIAFDKSQFLVRQLGDSISISLQNISGLEEEDKFHFKTESNVSSSATTAFIIRGGLLDREAKNARYKIGLSLDTGTWDETKDYDDDYKSLTVAANSVSYIYLEVDNKIIPTTVTAKSSTSYPAYDATKDHIILSRVNSYSHIVEEDFWEGGDFKDKVEEPDGNRPTPDTESLYRNNTSGRIEAYGFPTASDTAMSAGDLVLYQDLDGGTGGVRRLKYTGKVLDSAHSDTSDLATFATDSEHSSWSDYANAGAWPTTFDHPSLTNLDASDDHPHYWGNISWRNPDDDSYKTTGSCYSNDFAIQENPLNNFWTNVAAKITVTSDILFHGDNSVTLDADSYVAVTCPAYTCCATSTVLIQSVNNCTAESTTGYLILDGQAGVIISSDADIDVDAGDDLLLGAVDLVSINSADISLVASDDVDLAPTGDLLINGTPGLTDNSLCLVDPSTGDLSIGTFNKGILTALTPV